MGVQSKDATAAPRIGRRGVLALGATTVCAASAVGATQLVPYAEGRLVNYERDQVLKELVNLEGVSLDAAIQAAEITRAVVKVIVLPLARLVSAIGGDALGVLLAAVTQARNVVAALHLPTALLDDLDTLLTSWHDSASTLPIALNQYATADIDSAEAYLRALKKAATEASTASS
jgi:hypothetical protein